MKEIFISYRSADLEIGCIKVYEHLVREFGYDEVIFAHSNFKSGTEWLPQIRAGIAGSRVIVLIIGKSWEQEEDSLNIDQTDYLEEELKLASKLKIPIVPVCVGIESKNLKSILPSKFKWIHKIHALNFDMNTISSTKFINELIEILHKYKVKQGKSESNSFESVIQWLSLSASQISRLCFSPISATSRILIVSSKSIGLVFGELVLSLTFFFLSFNAVTNLRLEYSFLYTLFKAQSLGYYLSFFGGLIYCFSVYLNKQTFYFTQLVSISIHLLAASLIYLSLLLTLINFSMSERTLDILYESVQSNPYIQPAVDAFIGQLSNYEIVLFFSILVIGSYFILWNISGIIRGVSITHGYYKVWPIWIFVYVSNLLFTAPILYLTNNHTNLPLKFNWIHQDDRVTVSGVTTAAFSIKFKGDITLGENLLEINADELLIENREKKTLKVHMVWCGLGFMENNQFQWFKPIHEGYVRINTDVNYNQMKNFRISTIKIPVPESATSENTIVLCSVYLNNYSYNISGQNTFLIW
ncbi:toll/interleukin-1 receptor domain-containing protein [Methylotenera sp. 1P/1]|uniref:toll/interleukin-1 receptor domain-containing protein n=1 Tax=Methylotenera sp. 1P/1 TaxID=1131551 RepID=UPI0003768791|nr:toll/interleukin-1 receptor domain-containing protein [Methylotenera sp. 1P/1]